MRLQKLNGKVLSKIAKFKKLVTTPNILTEVNSLANQLGEPERSQCFTIFAQFSKNVALLDECYVKSLDAVNNDKFVKFGYLIINQTIK
ncbi:hypothetical protein [Nostoc sp. UIC 10630]|uniref:hypothetical protein n=1 Tax=Nostoc sp. UIC 10630 TaxID=2100146 RepID=UPI0013D7305C|nr:hypothetical protein [Nostoc sp. UIC 10630]